MDGYPLGRIWGFQIRAHPSALILLIFLVLPLLRQGLFLTALLWGVALGLSVLLHELGHALVIRTQGGDAVIVLHGFGGVTLSQGLRSPTQQIVVSLAGPVMNFGLVALAYVSSGKVGTGPAAELIEYFFQANLMLGIFNILPIVPLDGGQAMRAVLLIFSPRRAIGLSAWISLIILVPILAYAVAQRSLFLGMIGLFLFVSNYRDVSK